MINNKGLFSSNHETMATEVKKMKEKKKTVPLLKLFSFADFYDIVLMTIGSVGACIHEASVPIFLIFFGKLINIIGLAYLFPTQASHKVVKVLDEPGLIRGRKVEDANSVKMLIWDFDVLTFKQPFRLL